MFLDNLKKNSRITVIIIFLLIVVIALAGAIIYINKQNSPKFSLKGFESFQKNAIALQKSDKIANSKNYGKIIELLTKLDSENLSKDQQFETLYNLSTYVDFAYSETNSPELFGFGKTVNEFIRVNFPEQNWTNKEPQCLDSTCAQNQQPKEILAVIDEINQSTIPSTLKEEITHDLINFGYIQNEYSLSKVYDYLFTAEDIRNNQDFIKAGLSVKISDEIINYVKNAFPEEYSKAKTGEKP